MEVTAESADNGIYTAEEVVPLNKSKILRMSEPFAELVVGNPDIIDVKPLTNKTLYVLGKELGSTNLAIYKSGKRLAAIIDIQVGHDTQTLKRRLYELMPDEKIEVRAVGGSIVLSGTVSDSDKADQAAALANNLAGDQVTNLLKITGSQQVMLAVRFAEVKRSVGKALGFNNNVNFIGQDGNFGTDVRTGTLATPEETNGQAGIQFFDDLLTPRDGGAIPAGQFGLISAFGKIGEFAIDTFLSLLEEKGVATTLAEPNLIAMSGETATFLAGGEFPIPLATDDEIFIEFKQFGVSLAFTPTVLDENLINLVVAPEVSALDQSAGIVSKGLAVPGLTTRRAKTTVELRHGQSFAIAGLLQDDFSDSASQLPWIGDVPVLGTLARSSDYQRGETELVILVTPYLVQPSSEPLLASTDTFGRPSEFELFLTGQVESRIRLLARNDNTAVILEPNKKAPAVAADEAPASEKDTVPVAETSDGSGGLDGPFGYLLK
ncbi:MAG: type II and III secretion system protein family protein [Alphaproteobacteria bacterium]